MRLWCHRRLALVSCGGGVAPRFIVVTALLASVGIALAVPRRWPLWVTVVLVLIPWVPVFFLGARWNARRHHWLMLFYVLVVTQTGHFLEHVAQMLQIHTLHLTGLQARGVFGALDIEWVHFIWNAWVLLAAGVLLVRFRDNPWLWFTTLFAGFHLVEHSIMMWIYLRTGVVGAPGLLSLGGIIRGGLPLARPDLHFAYNLIETAPLIIAFFWQLRSTHAPAVRIQRRPAFVAPLCAISLVGVGLAGNFTDPIRRVIAPDGEVVCDSFHNLVLDVRAQAIPVLEIRRTLDDIELRTSRADLSLRPYLPKFVRAAREAVASYYTYPTFDALAYSDTYEHMEAHAHTYEAVSALSKACGAAGYAAKARPTPTNGAVQLPVLQLDPSPPELASGSLVVRTPDDAVATVHGYLADRPWGFFGATCAAWVSMHYLADQSTVGFLARDNEWVVDIPRNPQALGPQVLRYYVNARTGLTYGDEAHDLNSDFAEGCDKY